MSFQPTPEESATHEQTVTEDLGRTGKDPSAWLELYRTNQLAFSEPPRLPDTTRIPVTELEELVLSDRIDEALSCVSEMNAQHISSLLRYEAMEQTPEKIRPVHPSALRLPRIPLRQGRRGLPSRRVLHHVAELCGKRLLRRT